MIQLTEHDVDIRIKCAVNYTEISVLIQCLVVFFYSLQKELTAEGKYKHQLKQTINRANQLVINIANELDDQIRNANKGCVRSYIELYDKIMEALKERVALTGSERELSLIRTSLAIITDKLNYTFQHRFILEELKFLSRLAMVEQYVKDINIPSYDIEPIVQCALNTLTSAEEKQSAKERYMKYFNVKTCQ